jgi:hypothetical protein
MEKRTIEETYQEFLEMVEQSKGDFDKYLNLGNQSARRRFRKTMQGIRSTAFFLRKQIMDIENQRRHGE